MTQKIALIQCTSSKEHHRCTAGEMYSKSPRFRLSYQFAKMTCDTIFILSAKYGLLGDFDIIEPYNETLKNKGANERNQWAKDVMTTLQSLADLDRDYFTILAGQVYCEHLVPKLKHTYLPLKGKTQGLWIPTLQNLLSTETARSTTAALHHLFNNMTRLDWTKINSLPFDNGIYIMFEKGKKFQGLDRIVRIGTHKGQNRLKERLRHHFVRENADSSIFRKNVGRACTIACLKSAGLCMRKGGRVMIYSQPLQAVIAPQLKYGITLKIDKWHARP